MKPSTTSIPEKNHQIRRVVFGSDHHGKLLRPDLISCATGLGYDAIDCGPTSDEAVDYPDFAFKVVSDLQHHGGFGVLICGSGMGMCIAANRFQHIRAALVASAEQARLTRQHNDANVIVFGSQFITPEDARDCLRAFLEAEFEGGRHARRIEKLGS